MKLFLAGIFLVLIECTEVVNLNVGGRVFTTLRSTLEKAGSDSYLYNLFNSEMSKKTTDNDGNIFLDHDPDTFGLLLNLLRGYDVLKGKTTDEMTKLYRDADFFGMTDLMKRIEELPDEYVNTVDYRGGLKRKEKHGYGYGIEKTPKGSYKGEFEDGKWHGQGTVSDSNGVYKGEFKNGKKDGQGEISWLNGHKFVGTFKDDQYINGRYDYPDRRFHEGDFLNGKRHGKGKTVYPGGTIYDGDWQNDIWHGNGKYQAYDHLYEGDFHQGSYHGKGKKTFKDGRVQEGNWRNGNFIGNSD